MPIRFLVIDNYSLIKNPRSLKRGSVNIAKSFVSIKLYLRWVKPSGLSMTLTPYRNLRANSCSSRAAMRLYAAVSCAVNRLI